MFFAAALLIARMLGPYHFGVFALGLAVAQLGPEILDWGLSETMVRFGSAVRQDESALSGILLYVFSRRIWIAVAAAAGGGTLALLFARWTGQGELFTPLLIGVVGATLGLFRSYAAGYYQIREQFRRYSAIEVSTSAIVLAAVGIFFWLRVESYIPLLLAYTLIPCASFLTIVPDLLRRLQGPKSPPMAFLNQVHRFGSWLTLSTVSCAGLRRADTLLLAYFLPLDQVGLYAAALLLTRPLQMISLSVARVLFPKVSRMGSSEEFRRFGRYAWLFSLFGLGAAGLVMAISAPWLLALVGAKYAGSAWPFRWLLLVPVMASVSNLLSYIFLAKNAPRLPACINLACVPVNILLMVTLIPAFGIEGAAVAMALTAIAQAAAHGWLVRPHIHQSVPVGVGG